MPSSSLLAFFEEQIQAARETGDAATLWAAEKEAMDSVVKWFIRLIVMVFDPLAVTLVVTFNMALLRDAVEKKEFWKMVVRPVMAVSIIFLLLVGFIYFRDVVCRLFRL